MHCDGNICTRFYNLNLYVMGEIFNNVSLGCRFTVVDLTKFLHGGQHDCKVSHDKCLPLWVCLILNGLLLPVYTSPSLQSYTSLTGSNGDQWTVYHAGTPSTPLQDLESIKPFWHSDVIWWQRSWSTLTQVMASCLTAPGYYHNQCWLIVSIIQWHSSDGNFIWDTPAINH